MDIGSIFDTIGDAINTAKDSISNFKDSVIMIFNFLPSPFKEILLGFLSVVLVILIAKLIGVLK